MTGSKQQHDDEMRMPADDFDRIMRQALGVPAPLPTTDKEGKRICYIENEGALFRGRGRANPSEVYFKGGWVPYEGTTPKGVEWGDVIDEAEAQRMMARIDAGG